VTVRDRHPHQGARYGSFPESFALRERVYLITGGAGLLGRKHAEAILEAGGVAVLTDRDPVRLGQAVDALRQRDPQARVFGVEGDITKKEDVERVVAHTLATHGRLDGLVNNAALNPKMAGGDLDAKQGRFEQYPLERWKLELEVGLTGAFLCAQVAGGEMARRGGGSIINVASDLGIISPDQRIYRREGLPDDEQPCKPPSYSVIKGGLIVFTKYLATYWAEQNVRVNTLTPASVYDGQDWGLVEQVSQRVPLGRMSHPDEFKGALIFLLSDASSYMTGHNLVLDGGRTIW
jgi:NAD(P)-dependent dehydrogenase (short-subunit alcohol dehydrogenase family)